MTEYLSLEDLLSLVNDLGVGPVRDLGLLESAACRPATTLLGKDAYPSLAHKAAALLESLVRNHALVDGNKRLGWLAALVLLDINGCSIESPDDEAYDLVMRVADGRADMLDVALAFSRWTQTAPCT
ncbi:type II toxin-antitoxin system death-on-curing family toxin [Actinomyces slackii]|uniref:Death-on-curing family protein n=1 Tax=Actinomyces slackii TaxID=52774 RepID=A0A448KBN3_9ACTO|nr:type II toxin-antitoxin system death-on-curing family toxin [Actinomyces slackii]VEG74353.1 death-on-curing family protein [Actinomyces slackii]